MDMLRVLDLYLTSSSSEDESDLEEFEIFFNTDREIRRRRIPRVQNFIETVVYRFNSVDFQQTFRLRRTTFEYLLHVIGPDLQGDISDFGNFTISPEKQLLIALYVLGTPDSYRSVCSKFDVAKATAWKSVFRVVSALYSLRNYYIRWPTSEESRSTARNIENKYEISGVIAAVDGTHIKIPRPKHHKESYINRKNTCSIQLQVVANDKLEFLDCFAGFPGSVHDMRVFKYSGLQDICNDDDNFVDDSHMIADSAYTLQPHVITPYKDEGFLPIEERYFNKKLAQARSMVERAICLLKGRWRCLLDKLDMRRVDLIPFYIIACCVLHNICLKRDEQLIIPVIAPNIEAIDRGPLEPTRQQKLAGAAKRNLLRNILCDDV